MPTKKSKSIFEILDKDDNEKVTTVEMRDPDNVKKVGRIDPMVGLQLRYRNFNIANGKKSLNLNEFEKKVLANKNKKLSEVEKTSLDMTNQVALIKKARKKYRKSVAAFKVNKIKTKPKV